MARSCITQLKYPMKLSDVLTYFECTLLQVENNERTKVMIVCGSMRSHSVNIGIMGNEHGLYLINNKKEIKLDEDSLLNSLKILETKGLLELDIDPINPIQKRNGKFEQ